MIGIAHHRAEVGHLPMDPLQDFIALGGRYWQKLPGLVCKVFEYRAGFSSLLPSFPLLAHPDILE